MPDVDELFRAAIDTSVSKLEAGELPDRVFGITNKHGLSELRRFPILLDRWYGEQVSKVTLCTDIASYEVDNFSKLLWDWLRQASAVEATRAGASHQVVTAESVHQAINRIRRLFNVACESERKRLVSQASNAK